MTKEELKSFPMNDFGENNSLFFIWVTDPMLDFQMDIARNHWGLTYKTVGFYWHKLTKKSGKSFKGLGRYTRANTEQCWIFAKGNGLGFPKNRNIDKDVFSPIREHSQKPDIIRKYITEMYDGPYIELFARNQTPGWDNFGNEVNKYRTLKHYYKTT